MSTLHNEPTIDSRLAYEGGILNVRVDKVRLPGGGEGTREIVEHQECICVVPVDEHRNVIMVRQYRKPAEEMLLEVPAGRVESGEPPREAALRELQEETGHTGGDVKLLSSFWTTPGFCTELMHAYLVTDLTPSSLPQDDDEHVEPVKIPLDKIPGLISSGEIKDAKSIASLLMVLFLSN